MAAPDATPPRRRRRLVKTAAVFAWLMLYALLCVIVFIGVLAFVGSLVLMLHR
jgi:cytochrome b561